MPVTRETSLTSQALAAVPGALMIPLWSGFEITKAGGRLYSQNIL